MRFIMFMLPNIAEEDYGPTAEGFAEAAEEMGKYNEALEEAGVMLAGEGLHPQSEGARIVFERGKPHVVDGPFTETKEVVGGFWLIQAKSRDEAIEWAKRVPAVQGPGAQAGDFTIEVRQVYEAEEFPEEVRRSATPAS